MTFNLTINIFQTSLSPFPYTRRALETTTLVLK